MTHLTTLLGVSLSDFYYSLLLRQNHKQAFTDKNIHNESANESRCLDKVLRQLELRNCDSKIL